MSQKFIATEDQNGNLYSINIAEIASIEETDSIYRRIITLSVKDKAGNPKTIESIHSLSELNNLISRAQ